MIAGDLEVVRQPIKTGSIMMVLFPSLKLKRTRPWLDKVTLVIVIFFLAGMRQGQAQPPMDYAVQANIIYRFTKYIEWPESKRTGDFIIGIVGESPLTEQLQSFIINKTANSRKIVVKKFSSSAEIFNCHILFISDDESDNVKKIAARTAGDPILLVSESEGQALRGACINFIIVSDHLKLEINKNNIEQRNLNIASELLQLGKLVR
jgi:YfiR/HmsC-like